MNTEKQEWMLENKQSLLHTYSLCPIKILINPIKVSMLTMFAKCYDNRDREGRMQIK